MSNLNVVALQGNLVDNPKVMGGENAVARFTIAVNNGYGEKQSTTYVDCVAFGKQANVIVEHLAKGKQVIVRGQLMQNRWEDKKTGEKRSKLEVRLDNFNGFSFVSNGGGNGSTDTNDEVQETQVTAKSSSKAKTKPSDDEGKLF